jgi:hypothetical protein
VQYCGVPCDHVGSTKGYWSDRNARRIVKG